MNKHLLNKDIKATAGGWLFFFGLLGSGVEPDEAIYNATEENNVDGLMMIRYQKYVPWYGVILGVITYGLVIYTEIEMKGIRIKVKR